MSGFSIPEIEPRLSFNAPFGACPNCDGLGRVFDELLVVPNQDLSLINGAIAPWAKSSSPYVRQTINALCQHFGFEQGTSWKNLDENVKKIILFGSQGEKILFDYTEGDKAYRVNREFEGIIPNLSRRYRETDSSWVRDELERFQNNRLCQSCNGFRLKEEALAVRIAGFILVRSLNFQLLRLQYG